MKTRERETWNREKGKYRKGSVGGVHDISKYMQGEATNSIVHSSTLSGTQ
jgi:hypothetical protein